jgi:hypothetical protein
MSGNETVAIPYPIATDRSTTIFSEYPRYEIAPGPSFEAQNTSMTCSVVKGSNATAAGTILLKTLITSGWFKTTDLIWIGRCMAPGSRIKSCMILATSQPIATLFTPIRSENVRAEMIIAKGIKSDIAEGTKNRFEE